MNKWFMLFIEENIFCYKIDWLLVLLYEFIVLCGIFVLLFNMYMYIDMIFFYL